MKKNLLRESIWLVAVAIVAALLVGQLVGFANLFKSGMDIQLYDIYIVLEHFNFLYPVLPVVIFSVYLVRVVTLRFTDVMANVILIASAIVMIIFTTASINVVNELVKGWYVLPSTEELPIERSIPESPMMRIQTLLQGLRIFEYLIIILTGLLTFRQIRGRSDFNAPVL